ncbi:MAG: hypothetical protein JWR61_3309 [Ferruginibacter sp.]|uniref:hypothetical protein n=1 Tax=Ferruginibacter sp. TaxID=1940288 RepID=UPI00265B709F|nr:hypothetical protein [Ferruginibacter sp.]MDB5278354.1 hypothetical protein [Ferruginibacter sp.]
MKDDPSKNNLSISKHNDSFSIIKYIQMKIFLRSMTAAGLLFIAICTRCQPPSSVTASLKKVSPGLFDSDQVLEITLSGNLRDLLNDRTENPRLYPINIACRQDDSSEVTLNAQGKTRGHFRKLKENCLYPPLSIHFTQNDLFKLSVFKDQDKIKLVMPCQGDEYVIREWLAYKLYNLVTPKSFRARLVKINMLDNNGKKMAASFFAVFLEEEKQMAKRNNSIPLSKKLQPEDTETDSFLMMSVFEYLIGNTDWSVQYLQNIKLIAADSNAIPVAVPYDFDHAGIVNTPYAKPAEELLMNSVRERRYRGYCINNFSKFDSAVAVYNRIKNDIYSIYTNCTLLDEKYKKTTLKYLDEFYAVINNAAKMKKEFGYPCDKNGTGNVVIKGLKED